VAAAAVTAKIQAMDAVASNLGVSAQAIAEKKNVDDMKKREERRERREEERSSRSKSRRSRSRSRDRDRERDRERKSREKTPRDRSPNSSSSKPREKFSAAPEGSSVDPLPPPGMATLPTSLGNPTVSGISIPPPSLDDPEETRKALEAKQQEEFQKKLMEGGEITTLKQQENMQISGQSARHLVMQKLMRQKNESVVLILKNMVAPEEVDEDLQEEIQEECSKYGEVERVIIYQEKQSDEDDAEIVVKIFVEFKEAAAPLRAKEALHGRFFGGRIVGADIYDQDLYEHNDLSG